MLYRFLSELKEVTWPPSPSPGSYDGFSRSGTCLTELQMRKFMKELRRVPGIGSMLPNIDNHYVPGYKGWVPIGYMTISLGAQDEDGTFHSHSKQTWRILCLFLSYFQDNARLLLKPQLQILYSHAEKLCSRKSFT